MICSHRPIEGSHDIFGQAFSNLPRVAYALLHIPFVVRVLRLVGFGCGLWVLVCGLGFWVVGLRFKALGSGFEVYGLRFRV